MNIINSKFRLPMNFTNRLDLDLAKQNVGPDLDKNWFLERKFENIENKKNNDW